jgi:hypothetical protein
MVGEAVMTLGGNACPWLCSVRRPRAGATSRLRILEQTRKDVTPEDQPILAPRPYFLRSWRWDSYLSERIAIHRSGGHGSVPERRTAVATRWGMIPGWEESS